MRLLVFEFITGGGLLNQPLPAGLAREGELILQQLLSDLTECNEVECIEVLRDPRLPALTGDRCVTTLCRGDFRLQLAECCQRADFVLPVAPETKGALLELSELIQAQGSILLGSRPAAIRVTTSKWQTCTLLAERGMTVVPTFSMPQVPRERDGLWVVKPDDGVGGEGCRLINGTTTAFQANQIIQPLTAGQSASLVLLCHQGRADLYACNLQHVALDEHGCHLQGIGVNALATEIPALETLAAAVAAAIPDLWGWVGVDLILNNGEPQILEINPRLTTSYVGLRESLQCNPAALLLDLQRNDRLPRILGERRPVEIKL
jgi:tyramine---L-glutamate ligase